MSSQTTCASREVNTFEEYTLFSLERTTPALLNMMERSKRVATYWPEVGAMVEAAGLCQELAAMASFQMTLDGVFQFGDMTDAVGAEWKAMRERIQFVMDTLEDALTLNEAGPVKRLFSTVLPEALNQFVDLIPKVSQHVRGSYVSEFTAAAPAADGGED